MKANQKIKDFKADKSAYTQVVGGLVALLLTIIIGVLVFWEVDSGLGENGPWSGTTAGTGADQYSVADSVKANLSRNSTTDMAGTIFGLLPIVALVVVAAIILGVILGFGATPGSKGGI